MSDKRAFTTRMDAAEVTARFGWKDKTAEELNAILDTKSDWSERDSINLERIAHALMLDREEAKTREKAAARIQWEKWFDLWWEGILWLTKGERRPRDVMWQLRCVREQAFEDNWPYVRNRETAEWSFEPNWTGQNQKAKWWRKVKALLREVDRL